MRGRKDKLALYLTKHAKNDGKDYFVFLSTALEIETKEILKN